MSLFQCLILEKVEWRHTLFSFYVNEILLSSSYETIRKILGKQFGEISVDQEVHNSTSWAHLVLY